MKPAPARTQRGFTLLEISIVLALIGVILGTALACVTAYTQSTAFNKTVATMDRIEAALLDYSIANTRLPCPSDLAQKIGSANYGIEAANQGSCSGGTPAATSKAASGTVEGGVPTRTLRLPDEYMYDAWGRRFRYAVDPAYTTTATLPVAAACTSTPTANATAITVNDSTGAARTILGAYALISHGANGHGGYTSNGVAVIAGSANTDEQTNCHCNASAVATTYSPTYVQKYPTINSANALDTFDDIVTFKDGWQLQTSNTSVTAASCTQYIYVSDYNNNRVQIFNTSGTYLSAIGAGYNGITGSIGSSGSGNGQFHAPWGVAVDSSGNVWVADSVNDRVEEFNSSGTYLSQFGSNGTGNGQFKTVFDVAIDASGNFWAGDSNDNRVEEFNSSGSYLSQFGSNGNGNGQFGGGMSAIAFDAGGNLYVGDIFNDRVQKFNSSGSYLSQFGSHGNGNGQFVQVWGLALDASGNIYVTDHNNNRVQKFNSSGSYLSQFGSSGSGNGQFNGPTAIAIDTSGNIWVGDYSNNRVEEFNSSGSYLSQFGSSGTANGQFNGLYSIAITSR